MLARARSAEIPGPDTSPGPRVTAWPGPARRLPHARPGQVDLSGHLRLSLAALDARGRLRPVPSAGACHPVDVRLTAGSAAPLAPGRYGYDPLRHRVHWLGPAPAGAPPGVRVELTVTARRTTAHYGHRAWPLLLLDTGHAAAGLQLAARALGAPEAVVTLDAGTRDAADRAADGAGSRTLAARGVGDEPGPAPLASVYLPPPGTWRRGEPAQPPAQLLGRRSAPPPLAGAPDAGALAAVLACAQRAGGGLLTWCAAVGAPEPGLVTHAPGGQLRRLARGDARPTLAAWAAGQGWLAGAGAIVLAVGAPDDADAEHLCRAHLTAGHAAGLALATAARHGLRTRPVGSWQRADLGAALGDPPGRQWVVHGLALAAPAPRTPPETLEP
ncbi:SagB/ThcOx family dehydrogenase [Streptomyces sp. JJ66]|nr:SagB/ThcOx family dehydrogenase [Streptomyces sp. JJ66]